MGEMTYRRLGRCGTKVSALSLGGWTTYGGSVEDDATIRAIIRAAFDAGVNFFDCADVYAKGECERAMGRVLGELPRHELVISSKVFWPMSDDVNDRGLSRKHIVESVDRSLQRMGLDYFDLYFCHRYDPETPLEETVRAMDDLVRAGKIIYWGTSEWSGAQLRHAHGIAERRHQVGPQVEQPQYSLIARARLEQDVRPVASDLGMGLVVWSPLASGLLTGKYDDGVPEGSRLERIDWLRERLLTDAKIERVRRFGQLATELGHTRAQVALAWVASRAGISSVITGATRVEQLEENLGALDVELPPDAMVQLDELFGVTPAA